MTRPICWLIFNVFYSNLSPPTALPPRAGQVFTFKVVDIDDKATATDLTAVQIGHRYFLQICFTPGLPFNGELK